MTCTWLVPEVIYKDGDDWIKTRTCTPSAIAMVLLLADRITSINTEENG